MNKLYLICMLSMSLMAAGCASSREYTVNEEEIQKGPAGTVVLELKEMALGIGVEKGEGILTYQGQEYPFKMKGLDYGSISKITLQTTGNVYHLEDLSEFEGIYFRAKAGLTVGSAGKAGMFLINRKGVTIHLSSHEEKGFDLSLGRAGIKIKLIKDKKAATHSDSQ